MINRLSAIEEVLESLKKGMFEPRKSVEQCLIDGEIRYKKVPYGHRGELLGETSTWDDFKNGDCWGEPDRHYLFRLKVRIPEGYRGKEVLFFLYTGADDIWNTDNPQMLIYINGIRRCGMDMNHNSICIYEKSDWDKNTSRDVDIAIYAYSNLSENGNVLNMEVAAKNDEVMKAYFDLFVPYDAAKNFADVGENEKADVILKVLENACKEQDYSKISDYLMRNLYGKKEGVPTVASVGHTHIDVAWKWPLRQTREKVIRSYSTVMELMKRYPEYLFMASTPQMYEFVREDEPELFDEILEKVKEGKFEPEGAMWLEADCNLTSGESLVRQILYGKRYFKETFGIDSDILWLPDVFGYSAAMPQILKKAGIRTFITTKLAWNDTNRMPYDLFNWVGIDGSSILAYLITSCDYKKADEATKSGGLLEYTYNGRQNAGQIMGAWKAFREKDVTDEILTCYGFGDGGGGPTWEMLEMDRRLKLGVPGIPVTEQKSVTEFVNGLIERVEKSDKVPTWSDELYLEYHRGTYTSMGQNKRYNRRLELLLKEAEEISTFASGNFGKEYPKAAIDEAWKVLMLNQFHDILPGSSIEEVYLESKEQYENAIKSVKEVIEEGLKCISDSKYKFDAINKEEVNSEISWGVLEDGSIQLSTPYYYAFISENGEIISLFDKETGYEIRNLDDTPLGRLIAFEDKPKDYDCWNIDSNFEDVSWFIDEAESIEIISFDKIGREINGDQKGNEIVSKVSINVRRKFREASMINQSIVFYSDNKRIDYKTKIDWHEHQTLLKAAFPVNVDSDEINCEIQYGSLRRSLKRETSYEKAKFECCAHKWIDISDKNGEYGVAILNDSKYGYDAKDKLMRLTLIKSGIFPNPNADQGVHEFTYSLLPHSGDFREGRVIEAARELNYESHYFAPEKICECGYKLAELVEREIIDVSGEPGVFVEAIKKAEDSDAVIVRLYEGYGQIHEVKAGLFSKGNVQVKNVVECDLLENPCQNGTDGKEDDNRFVLREGSLSFTIKPFEIKTFKVEVDRIAK